MNKNFLEEAQGWPFEEAKKLLNRFHKQPPTQGYVLFETGYGPSGLPHIGTFGEVIRTSFVRHAFEKMSGLPTRLICFSDDMDGLRKVPLNIPMPDLIKLHLEKPLTAVPDPFGTHESFGHHNNALLCHFLDSFQLEYELFSATHYYKSGFFNEFLLKVLAHHQEILEVILPTLRPERQKTYSPFLPLCPDTGKVLQVPVVHYNVDQGTIVYLNQKQNLIETPVTNGFCKLQWKVDWGMRWAALGIHYEIAGKDLIDSVKLSSKICKILGSHPPEGFNYEFFLDQNSQKISKSKGEGLCIEDWLKYAPIESLSYFLYQSPKRAKRLIFDIIPRCVDEYFENLEKFFKQSSDEQKENPVWHIHKGHPPDTKLPFSFQMLLNLVSACNFPNSKVLWRFIQRYAPSYTPENSPKLDQLVQYALSYYRDFIEPYKQYSLPTPQEREALGALLNRLNDVPSTTELIQEILYDIGKTHAFPDLKSWFQSLYKVLLGQKTGPRMSSFILLYGIAETQELIQTILNKEK